MNTYELTYARVVILKCTVEAYDITDAQDIAMNLERRGILGLREVDIAGRDMLDIKDHSFVDSITDYDVIWDIKLEEGEEPPEFTPVAEEDRPYPGDPDLI